MFSRLTYTSDPEIWAAEPGPCHFPSKHQQLVVQLEVPTSLDLGTVVILSEKKNIFSSWSFINPITHSSMLLLDMCFHLLSARWLSDCCATMNVAEWSCVSVDPCLRVFVLSSHLLSSADLEHVPDWEETFSNEIWVLGIWMCYVGCLQGLRMGVRAVRGWAPSLALPPTALRLSPRVCPGHRAWTSTLPPVKRGETSSWWRRVEITLFSFFSS